ncbi:MAG TPA: CcdC protein domain-containing protein [Allosphingosinicella sp.]
MQGAAGQPNPLIGYVVMALVLTIVLIVRVRSVNQVRPLKVERLWIIPIIYLVLAVLAFATTPPNGAGWLASIVALVLGAALGWQRGRLMRIDVDPQSHSVTTVQSPAALFFIVILIAIRSGMRSMAQTGAGGFFHMSPATLTDILVAFALGLLAVQRLEMYLRARRLLAEARRHRPA